MKTIIVSFLLLVTLAAAETPPALRVLRVLQTPRGTHYGIRGDKPAKPAPTLFIVGNPIATMRQENIISSPCI